MNYSTQTKCTLQISESKSNTEMAQLEAALCSRRAKSAVQSRLRIKNLTLTPRHSLQQLLVLQSGDAIDVKATLTQTKLVKSSEDISLLKTLAKEGKLEWNFTLHPQATTVGFAFTNFTKPLEDKPRENFKSSSSGVTSADADHSNKRSCSTIDQENSKKASESTKSNTMSETLFSQYYPPKILPQAKKSEASACVQADCKEFDELFDTCSNEDEQCLGNIVVDAMKSLVAGAMVESAKLQTSESRPMSSKNKMSGNSAQTVVEKTKEYKSVDVGVGCDETAVSESQSPRLTAGVAQTEHCVQTIDDFSNMVISKVMDSKVVESQANSNKSIDYSSSLDILVGLLNEIQTITTCQTNMTKKMAEKSCENSFNCFDQNRKRSCQVKHVLSITSLDKMRQLESNPSVYSFYISSDGDFCNESVKSEIIQTSCLTDTEMNTLRNDAVECRLVSRPTDVPSMLFCNFGPSSFPSCPMPSGVHQTTSVTSLTVNHSIISLHEYKSVVSITEVVAEAPVKSDVKSKVKKANVLKNTSSLPRKAVDGRRRTKARRVKANYGTSTVCDPLIKIKRDILVAVYSMLVVTVFAALSFPDLMNYR